jgi:hypothetical protein
MAQRIEVAPLDASGVIIERGKTSLPEGATMDEIAAKVKAAAERAGKKTATVRVTNASGFSLWKPDGSAVEDNAPVDLLAIPDFLKRQSTPESRAAVAKMIEEDKARHTAGKTRDWVMPKPAGNIVYIDPRAEKTGGKIVKKTRGGGQGVIERLIMLLRHAPVAGLTVEELAAKLHEQTNRPIEHLTRTIRTQLSRLPKEKGIKIDKMKEGKIVRYREHGAKAPAKTEEAKQA